MWAIKVIKEFTIQNLTTEKNSFIHVKGYFKKSTIDKFYHDGNVNNNLHNI